MTETYYISEKSSNSIEYQNDFKDALLLMRWQKVGAFMRVRTLSEAFHRVLTYDEYDELVSKGEDFRRNFENRYWYILFKSTEQFNLALSDLMPIGKYTWSWKYQRNSLGHPIGYEVTSRGDRRFSPYFQKVWVGNNLITGQEYFENFIKPLTNRKGTAHKFFTQYLSDHRLLFYELAVSGLGMPLTDMFDKGGGQNKVYCDILNSYYGL